MYVGTYMSVPALCISNQKVIGDNNAANRMYQLLSILSEKWINYYVIDICD